MSESAEKDDAPKPFSALSFDSPQDPGTLSLSDSDPALSDDAEVESLSAEEEEDDDEEVDHKRVGGPPTPLQPFTLKGMDAGFSQRSVDIFGGLLDVQKCSPLSQLNKKGKHGVFTSLAHEDSAPSCNLTEPKKKATAPCDPVTQKRSAAAARLPDYLAHPERWTKYNLDDVPDTDDRANRNTALKFLAELKSQKDAKEMPSESSNPLSYNQGSSSSTEGRIVFTKPQKKNQKDCEKSKSPSGEKHRGELWGDDELDDDEGFREQNKSETMGFHGSKKRSRKNIRPKADDKEEEDTS